MSVRVLQIAMEKEFRSTEHSGRKAPWLVACHCYDVSGMDTLGSTSDAAENLGGKPPSESELLAFFQLSLEMLCIASDDGYFKRVNPAFEKTLGYSEQELLSRPFVEFVHPDDQEKTRQELDKLIQGVPSIRFENRYRCQDGTYRWLSWMATPQEDGECIYAAASDITERKASEERFRLLIEFAPDAMVVVDDKGQIVLVNSQTETLFGYSSDELLGQTVELLVPHGLRHQHLADRTVYAANPRPRRMGMHANLSGRRKDGSEFPAEIALSPLGTEQGALVYAAIRDLTERRRAEETLRENLSQLLAAQKIQEHLLPLHPPVLPGFDIAGASYPAEFAAGDHFDFLSMPDQCLGIVTADVAGHGIGPAILMASIHAHLHSLAATCTDVGEILSRANRIVIDETDSDRFITVLFVRLDPRTRTLVYASAGHPTAYILDRQGDVKAILPSTSFPLGVVPNAVFSVGTPITLEPGDIALLFTDGLLEATAENGNPFGRDHMLQVVACNRTKAAPGIVHALYEAVNEFSGGKKLSDDITVVVIKVEAKD